jgi:transcriptional regulator with XRE-family HTH domain
MARKSTRDNLVTNLRWLMDEAGWTQMELQARSGVSQKSISKILGRKMVPTIDLADKLAAAFGLSGWHIIMPDLPRDLSTNTAIEKLFRDYLASSQRGRDFIAHVANVAAQEHDQTLGNGTD